MLRGMPKIWQPIVNHPSAVTLSRILVNRRLWRGEKALPFRRAFALLLLTAEYRTRNVEFRSFSLLRFEIPCSIFDISGNQIFLPNIRHTEIEEPVKRLGAGGLSPRGAFIKPPALRVVADSRTGS